MNKAIKIIVSVLIIVVLMLSFSVNASASSVLGNTFWEWVYEQSDFKDDADAFLEDYFGLLFHQTEDYGCTESLDGYHSWNFDPVTSGVFGTNIAACRFCHMNFNDYCEVLYDASLDSGWGSGSGTGGGGTGEGGAGKDYGLRLLFSDGQGSYYYRYYGYDISDVLYYNGVQSVVATAGSGNSFSISGGDTVNITWENSLYGPFYFDFKPYLSSIMVPVAGTYQTIMYTSSNGFYTYGTTNSATDLFRTYYKNSTGTTNTTEISYLRLGSNTLFGTYYNTPFSYESTHVGFNGIASGSHLSNGVRFSANNRTSGNVKYWINVKVTPLVASDIVTPDDLIVNITGDIYVINDDGTYTVINNNTFINNENNTFYNPTTNEYYNYIYYTINYEDFTIEVYLDTGDTVTINYGDQYITVDQSVTYIDNSTGDTVTNNYTYNYYYYGDGTGSGGDGDDDSTSFWQWLKDRFFNALGALIDKIFEWILDLLDFLIDGLFSMLKGLWGIVNDVLFGFGDLVGEFFGAFKEGGGLFDFDGVTYDYEPLTT